MGLQKKTKSEFDNENNLTLIEIEVILTTLASANFEVRNIEPLYHAIEKLNKKRQQIKEERES